MSLLTFANLKTDLAKMVGTTSSNSRNDISSSITSAIIRAQEDFVNYGDWSFLEQYTDRVYIPIAAPYTTGTISVTQDSKTVTGSGTTWTKDMEGSFLAIDEAEVYEIRSFTSTTSIDLAIPYQNDTASAQTYSIYKRFYNLPLNFSRPHGKDAKLLTPGSSSEVPIAYSVDASFSDAIVKGKPQWFGIAGNQRSNDYHNTGTVTITTTGGVSTWTFSSATLPTDIVDREIRIVGESRSYFIKTRSSSSAAITYDTYVNPADATNTLSTASSYAITPKETQLIGFSNVADQRYIFSMPYIKRLPEMILDSDVSPIVHAGYSNALLTLCRKKIAEDGRIAMRADLVQTCIAASEKAMADAWYSETHGEEMRMEGAMRRPDRIQQGPSWISR